MAKDGTARGGARAGSGRKSKALKEKLDSGNPGGRKLTVMELPADSDLSGEDMPEPKSYMLDRQKNGGDLDAEDVFRETWLWLKERGCEKLVSTQLVRNYAMSVSRWIQCEHAISEYGFLAKHPTTGQAIASPYVFLSAKSVDELAEKLRKVKAWLYSQPTGYHTLTDSYDKKFFRKAVFASSLDIEDELNKIGVFTISFNCKPFKYSFDGDMPHYIKGTMSDFSLIFCRMDGSTSDNNWDNRWNQTDDLKISGENNMYIIAENSWSDGNWGTYSPSQSNTVYLQVNEN